MKIAHPEDPQSKVFEYMGRTGLDGKKGAEILASAVGKYSSTVEYPASTIAASLKGIAQDFGVNV